MRAFACPTCRRLVTFERVRCLHCATALAYEPQRRAIGALGENEHRCANAQRARAVSDWPQRHVSAYATMHPWEDWAETFAHCRSATRCQTAASYGLRVEGSQIETTDEAPCTPIPSRTATCARCWTRGCR